MAVKGYLEPRMERFCQAISEGKNGADSYLWAGYETTKLGAGSCATRLLKRADIQARIAELLQRRADIEIRATEIAAQKLAITRERVLLELARIAFSDIRKAVSWSSAENDPNGGTVVEFKSSDEIDDDTALAIAEVAQNSRGGLKIKFYDKHAALVDLGRHLGMFVERHEHTGKDGGPIDMEVTDVEAARRVVYMLATAATRKLNGPAATD